MTDFVRGYQILYGEHEWTYTGEMDIYPDSCFIYEFRRDHAKGFERRHFSEAGVYRYRVQWLEQELLARQPVNPENFTVYLRHGDTPFTFREVENQMPDQIGASELCIWMLHSGIMAHTGYANYKNGRWEKS